jgi:phosphonoacetate hydrolase
VQYRWPDRPVVVVCIDGGDPAYLDKGLEKGILPNVARFMATGFSAIAQCVIPSFTCPNNVSIVTGAPPSIHGISGNFYLEPETGNAVVMTGPELMRSTTILAEFSRSGARVASITAKDKLRQQLGKGMNIAGGCINFSSEKADKCNTRENGIENVLELVGMPLPDMYSPELSLLVLEAGIRFLQTAKPLIIYLSLTDYIQHKYAPGEPDADRYYRNMDDCFGRLDEQLEEQARVSLINSKFPCAYVAIDDLGLLVRGGPPLVAWRLPIEKYPQRSCSAWARIEDGDFHVQAIARLLGRRS